MICACRWDMRRATNAKVLVILSTTRQSRRSAFHPHLQSCLRAGCGRQICDMHHTHMKVRCLRQSQWCRSDIHREPPGRHSEVIAEHRAPSRSSSQACTSTGPFANAQQHCAAACWAQRRRSVRDIATWAASARPPAAQSAASAIVKTFDARSVLFGYAYTCRCPPTPLVTDMVKRPQ